MTRYTVSDTIQSGTEVVPSDAPALSGPDVVTSAHLLVEQLRVLAGRKAAHRPLCYEYISQLQELSEFRLSQGDTAAAARQNRASAEELKEFGRLLRDRRTAAGFSRLELARKARLSDATIKFTETARQPPSRTTLIRLIGVDELRLSWNETPGQMSAPAPPSTCAPPDGSETPSMLNSFIAPTYDPLRMVADFGRFLDGKGGHVEQTHSYLDHQSAAAYLALLTSGTAAAFRARSPLAEAAKQIAEYSGTGCLRILALGAGDGSLEVRLVQHLAEAAAGRRIELCLLDISQPLLTAAYKHAAELLSGTEGLHVWAMQCNFHHLPQYTQLFSRQGCRVFCMLGGTLANLDNEPRFFQHSLIECSAGDLLLVDMQVAQGNSAEEIKKRDHAWEAGVPTAHAAWLGGPIWRHCKDVVGVDFALKLDLRGAVPGSYALDAVATVRAKGREDRHFSMFRFRRYDPVKLAGCLEELGWDELAAMNYGSGDRPSCLMLLRKR